MFPCQFTEFSFALPPSFCTAFSHSVNTHHSTTTSTYRASELLLVVPSNWLFLKSYKSLRLQPHVGTISCPWEFTKTPRYGATCLTPQRNEQLFQAGLICPSIVHVLLGSTATRMAPWKAPQSMFFHQDPFRAGQNRDHPDRKNFRTFRNILLSHIESQRWYFPWDSIWKALKNIIIFKKYQNVSFSTK